MSGHVVENVDGARRYPSGHVGKGWAVKINHQIVVFDAADIGAESSFWAGLLGGIVEAEDDWHTVMVEGRPQVAVQLAPDHVPPD